MTAASHAVRLAYAEYIFRDGRKEVSDSSAQLTPSNAEYQARAGRLERAVRLNPYFSDAWIEMGLGLEREGDWVRAEAALREAARVDKTFKPKWTLANYFYRRDRSEEFWSWIRAAAEMSYGDRTALFQLCWRASQDPEWIFARAIPPEHDIVAGYLAFLAGTGRYEAGIEAALRLLRLGSAADVPNLMAFCDLLLARPRHAYGAVRIWNGMIERHWLPYERLDPSTGLAITNASFLTPPRHGGFDWRAIPGPGVRILWIKSGHQLMVGLDGSQAEDADLLAQWLPLAASSGFELAVEAQSDDLGGESGLSWRLMDAATGESIAETQMMGVGGRLRFVAPARSLLARLVLHYRRPLGSPRVAGTMLLSGVTVRRITR